MSMVCFFTLLATGLIITTNIKVNGAAFVRLGDAVASFLEEPEGEEQASQESHVPKRRCTIQARATPWIPLARIPWYKAVETRSCLVVILTVPLCLLALVLSHLVKIGLPIGLADLWRQGLGQVNNFTLVGGTWQNGEERMSDFVVQILFVNFFHLLVSLAYVFTNLILSKQLVAAEWTALMRKKALRVTWPEGLQRSSYMLAMPFRYSIPLMATCTCLHWLVSQSVFIVQTSAFETGKEDVRIFKKDSSRAGYSPIAIVLATINGAVLVAGVLIHSALRSYKKVPADFPRMASSSAAISAVCHPPSPDKHAHLFPVSMGVVQDSTQSSDQCIPRLTFTTWLQLQDPHETSSYIQPVYQREHVNDKVKPRQHSAKA
ncbi:hypothetical protein E8E14_006199 [Neopestalotiopsis sp. 37M]|nr:hypothetical protein E8E14_006199 [Neopestalotiopsis sp. 37M]